VQRPPSSEAGRGVAPSCALGATHIAQRCDVATQSAGAACSGWSEVSGPSSPRRRGSRASLESGALRRFRLVGPRAASPRAVRGAAPLVRRSAAARADFPRTLLPPPPLDNSSGVCMRRMQTPDSNNLASQRVARLDSRPRTARCFVAVLRRREQRSRRHPFMRADTAPRPGRREQQCPSGHSSCDARYPGHPARRWAPQRIKAWRLRWPARRTSAATKHRAQRGRESSRAYVSDSRVVERGSAGPVIAGLH
jgi:hypothetical protein